MHVALVLVMQTSDQEHWMKLGSSILLSLAFFPPITSPLVYFSLPKKITVGSNHPATQVFPTKTFSLFQANVSP